MGGMSRETHLREGRQTVKLGLVKVVKELFPEDELQISYSILEGVFCGLDNSALSVREVREIDRRLREWTSSGAMIEEIARENGYYVYRVGGVEARVVYPALLDPAEAEPFSIVPFSGGFIVDFGDREGKDGHPMIRPMLLSETFEKTRRWLDMLRIETVEDVNRYIAEGQAMSLVDLAEALHEKQIAGIADLILRERRALRMLLVAGPSSSGKSTFIRRISTQLLVAGLRPVSLSLDDYFLDRRLSPRDEHGGFDFERLEALDLPLLRRDLRALIDGAPVDIPRFDFVTGTRSDGGELRLADDDVLVLEGIHALNPALMERVPPGAVFKVYVSALGGLNIDRINRVSTTDTRLLRRLVRDVRTRGIGPDETLERWQSVRRGEYDNVFRFQEDANVMFNSSLMYEINALRPSAEAVLAQVEDASPHREVRDRLLNLVSYFEPVDSTRIPFNSILREFIGGSAYGE